MQKPVEALLTAKIIEFSVVGEDTGCLAPCYQLAADRVPDDVHGFPPTLLQPDNHQRHHHDEHEPRPPLSPLAAAEVVGEEAVLFMAVMAGVLCFTDRGLDLVM